MVGLGSSLASPSVRHKVRISHAPNGALFFLLLIMFNPVVKRGRCRPTEKPGSVKYGLRGMFSEASFRQTGINSKWRAALIKAANHSLAQNTWSSYRSALKSLEKCSSETGTAMTFPLSEEKALTSSVGCWRRI